MKRTFFWQPESANAVIYWSFTLIILFYSLILSLENTRPYWKSNLVLAVFIFFVVIGLQRRVCLDGDKMTIYYTRFWKKDIVFYHELKQAVFKNKQLKLQTDRELPILTFRKKDHQAVYQHFLQTIPQKIEWNSSESTG